MSLCQRSGSRRHSRSPHDEENGYPPEDIDPLSAAIAPPPDETPVQREIRERLEEEARKVSEGIDELIRAEERAAKRKKRPVKVMLLGQSESGKSATLKNFQLTYSHREWVDERNSWRAVIHLNLVRNINEILEMLTREMMPTVYSISDAGNGSDDDYDPSSSSPSTVKFAVRNGPKLVFSEKHRSLRNRLAVLGRVESVMQQRLGSAATEVENDDTGRAAPFEETLPSPTAATKKSAHKEFGIHSTNGWKGALSKFKNSSKHSTTDSTMESETHQTSFDDPWLQSDVQAVDVLVSCREDIKELWEDPIICEMLNRRKFRIEDSPGFFLNDWDRIANRSYVPTDEDVVRARLRTLGVQEYRITFDHGPAVGQEWWLYDVGGARSSRAAWYPYFEDVSAIIFLAPISCFDEKLAENRKVNRLEDSYLLWRSVCSCKLLSRAQLILFLNKCDLLQAKLSRGTRIRDHVPSYSDRKNDMSTATRYFQQHFKEILKQCSPAPRPFFVHLTSVIDTKSTAVTLAAVEESILRDHLRRADLM